MDNYVEQIVEGKPNGASYAKVVVAGIITAIGAVITLMTIYIGWGLLLVCAGGYLIYYTKNCLNLEYEYEITNGDVSIDKIINKASRKHVLDFSEGDIQRILTYKSAKFQNELEINKKMSVEDMTSGDEENSDNWYAFIVNDKKNTVAVVLELKDKSKNHVEEYFKRRIER